MAIKLSDADAGKFAAASRAIAFVEDGMRIGLGTGSTAAWMVRALAARVEREGLILTCVPTSTRTARQARELGLTVVTLDEAGWLDLTIDGADEFDPDLNLIKGGGGAHLQEKIVAAASDRMIVITDPSKAVAQLGAFPLPVEVIPFGLDATQRMIDEVLTGAAVGGRDCSIRMNGEERFFSDEGNHIIDLHLARIDDLCELSQALMRVPGVVETGLFLGMCNAVVIGHADGRTETRFADETPDEAGQVDLAEADDLPVEA
ncbi:ribose-5-phosphate isomerase RpiA [Pseudoruegeria sp. SK021]|uniref:ribose-5-phosphate isomerase RpiA n=1 Tax=Pseudoruegeria sp. SK021 TaxID=1933035 RepID=UPI000A24B9BA|nr:ribose-5-phosphate isomerase RpiA [Pseudoruegeria sp. SK021]OSP56701.1 ribose 5-phosphate isomerase A [Pseudoruegeria sp. SK021]